MKLILTSSYNTVANELNDKHILPSAPAKVAFITTAGDPYKETPWIEKDRKALINLGYDVFDYDLKGKMADELQKDLENADIIFVAGGNTTYFTKWSHESGFGTVINELLENGAVYVGSSAGSILAGSSVKPFIEEDLPDLEEDFEIADPSCLGLVDYIILPHYPDFAKENDKVVELFSDQFTFVKMTDSDYKVEEIGN